MSLRVRSAARGWIAANMRHCRTQFVVLLLLLAAVYGGVVVATRALSFGVDRDELHFWPTSVQFSHSFIPSLDLLRSYKELNTPLPFYVFGQLERLSGGHGLVLSRFFNLTLTLLAVGLIAWPRGRLTPRSFLAAVGILVFPYFIGTATHAYTDTLAMFFALLGVWLYLKDRLALSAVALALAIASRQYMIAFPGAILAYEWLCRRSLPKPQYWVWPLLALATFGGWYVLWDGFGPPTAIAAQGIATSGGASLLPHNALYFLVCLGAYFCIPEAVLFRRLPPLPRSAPGWLTAVVVILALAAIFWRFPPRQNVHHNQSPTMGYLDIAANKVFRDRPLPVEIGPNVQHPTITLPPATGRTVARMTLYYLLALLAVWRFARPGLEMLLVGANTALTIKAHVAWDKYTLALIAVLWMLQALPRGARIGHTRRNERSDGARAGRGEAVNSLAG